MAILPCSYRLVAVPGGLELRVMARSPRGTKFILDSVVMLTSSADRAGLETSLNTCVEDMCSKHQPMRLFPVS